MRRQVQGLLAQPPGEELKAIICSFLDSRLQAAGGRLAPKELSEDLQKTLNINGKQFRNIFSQTLVQYVQTFQAKGPGANFIPLDSSPMTSKRVSSGEQNMRVQRAARFQSHIQVEKTSVAMSNFREVSGSKSSTGPLVGALEQMCSRDEANERQMTRQLDKMEWKKNTDAKNPEANLTLTTKKYQRSSADKAYMGKDVRTLDACWRTMEYLMTEILDFDKNPKPQFAVQKVPYIEVYSYLRDRTRSCRVDLHLQQPRSTAQRSFIESHECCLRFEMLSIFLLQGGESAGSSTEKYDVKLGLKAISQTIEPLLNAYSVVQDRMLTKSILAEALGGMSLGVEPDGEQEYSSLFEPSVHRYIILLLMAFSPEELLTHLAKLSRDTLSHPLVNFATQAFASFRTDDYGRFLRLYREADFLSAVAMSGVVDLARLRALWLLVRTYCQPVGDKITLKRLCNILAFATESHCKSFLAFHGVMVQSDPKGGGSVIVLPKKGTPEALAHPLLTGPGRLPEKCDYPKGLDSMLVAKYEALGLSRVDIVFGVGDPIVEPVEELEAEAAEGDAEAEPAEVAEGSAEVEASAPLEGAGDAEVAAEIEKDA